MYKFFLIILFIFISTIPAYSKQYCININWFENFNDENLMNYIFEVLNSNKDIQIAKKNILKYRQERNLKISREFPTINVGANYLLLKIPKLAIPNNDIQTNSFALPFMALWEIDWLGKNYNKIQQAKLDYDIAKSDEKSAALFAVVDFAQGYFELSNLNKQIELTGAIKNLTEEIYKRKKHMFDAGVISAIELNLAKSSLLERENELDNLLKQKEIYTSTLKYLLAQSSFNKDELKITPFEKINFTGIYPDDFKGDIILNRPDIQKAENEVKKAKIDITIAKKDFLPNINIFGLMVFSTVVQNFGWDGVFANLLAGATQNLFDGGKRIFTLKKRKIEYETAIEEYLKKDLNALKEINDALYAVKKDLEVYKNNDLKFRLSKDNFIKIFNSYESGSKSYIDNLNENINLMKSDMALINSKEQNFINLITLYKAVGGAL